MIQFWELIHMLIVLVSDLARFKQVPNYETTEKIDVRQFSVGSSGKNLTMIIIFLVKSVKSTIFDNLRVCFFKQPV